jgi:hypothetical protein
MSLDVEVRSKTKKNLSKNALAFEQQHKVIHPKYYKHLKKGAVWADKKWAGFWQISLYIK